MKDTANDSGRGIGVVGAGSYRFGFYALAAVLAVVLMAGLLILDTYNKTPEDVVNKLMGASNTEPAPYVWLPDHYVAHLGPAPYSYTENVKTLEDFNVWKRMPGGIVGIYEDRPTVRDAAYDGVEIVEASRRDSYTMNKITMPSFLDPEIVIFYELLPDVEESYDAVFVIPGNGHGGALDVLGEPGPWQGYYYQDGVAKALVRENYAVYVIELLGYGERALDVGSACSVKGNPATCSAKAVENKMTVFGINIADIRTDEITQVLAYIESRPYIRNVAVAGLSLGAGLAANQAIINGDVVDAVIMASGIRSVLHSPINLEGSGSVDVISCCDSVDKLATIAPMPAYVSFGLQESTEFRWEAESGYTGNFLAEVYGLHNASESLHYVVHEGAHEYHIESVMRFLDVHLGG